VKVVKNLASEPTFSEHQEGSRRLAHSGPFRKMVTGVALFLTVCIVAVVGYVSAGWKLADSIYMVIITIFGVG
jgi:voltage-gated potassium channel